MIQENQNQCQWKAIIVGHEHTCNRPPETGDYCILHDPSPDKDKVIFLREIQAIVDTDEAHHNFMGVHFFTDDLLRRSYRKTVSFDGAVFHCNANFKGVQFDIGYSFLGTTFIGGADFSGGCRMRNGSFAGATFQGSCSFSGASFQERTDFINVIFDKDVSFERADFTHSGLVMKFVRFLGSTSFNHCKLVKEVARFRFDNCDLKGLLLSKWNMFPDKTVFENVIWPKKKYMRLTPGRLSIADELSLKDKKLVLRAYEHLHRYYFDSSEYDIASEFYVSSMVMRRKVEKLRKGAWIFDITYSALSRYGESVWRPLGTLLLLWLLVPAVLLYMGLRLDPEVRNQTEYIFSFDWNADFIHDYWKAFRLNFSLSTIVRGDELRPSVSSPQGLILTLESLFSVLLASFAVLGIRRKFAPKKPVSSS